MMTILIPAAAFTGAAVYFGFQGNALRAALCTALAVLGFGTFLRDLVEKRLLPAVRGEVDQLPKQPPWLDRTAYWAATAIIVGCFGWSLYEALTGNLTLASGLWLVMGLLFLGGLILSVLKEVADGGIASFKRGKPEP